MTLRTYLANWLHSLAYRIEPQTWYAPPKRKTWYPPKEPPPPPPEHVDSIANVEFVRGIGVRSKRSQAPKRPNPGPVLKPGKGG